MSNPYAASNTFEEPRPSGKRRRSILVFCVTVYSLHTIVLWAIACFHDAHVASELKEPFATIATDYGRLGLFGVALQYAMVPTTLYAVCLTSLSYFVRSHRRWTGIMDIARLSLGPGLVLDGILGLPLFTTG